MSVTHNLKIDHSEFDAILRGDLTCIVRRNHEGFQKTQRVRLTRHRGPGVDDIDPKAPRPVFEISHVSVGHLGITPGYAVLSLALVDEEERAAA